MADSVWYPSVEDIVAIHDDIISEYPDTPSSTQNRGDIEFALDYIEKGTFSSAPETIQKRRFISSGSSSPTIPSSMQTSVPLSTPRSSSTFSTAIGSNTMTKSGHS